MVQCFIIQCFSIAVIFSLAFQKFKVKEAFCNVSLEGHYYPFLCVKPTFWSVIRLFHNCLFCRIVWYTCNMLSVVICKNCFILWEAYAGALSVLIFTMAIISNRCVVTEFAFSVLKTIAHWNLEYASLVWYTCFNFQSSANWNIFICQISLPWVPFELLSAGVGFNYAKNK